MKINTASVRSAAVESEGQNRGIPSYRSAIRIEEGQEACRLGLQQKTIDRSYIN